MPRHVHKLLSPLAVIGALAAAPAMAEESPSSAAQPAQAGGQLALPQGAPEEAFGEYSYFDAYPKRDPNDLIDQSLWTTCWAMTEAERLRLAELSETAPPGIAEELHEASLHYQVAEIYYSEIVRGTAIFQGAMMSDVNDALEIEQQALIGGAPHWLASNAADCVYRMPEASMPEFEELYPWLVGGLGTFYTN